MSSSEFTSDIASPLITRFQKLNIANDMRLQECLRRQYRLSRTYLILREDWDRYALGYCRDIIYCLMVLIEQSYVL